MLSNTLALTDGTTSRDYDLVSRLGMRSVRRDTSATSTEGSALIIDNTVDLNAPTKQNRHLVQFTWSEIDGTTGELYPCSVHMVIARHKKAPDADVLEKVALLADFCGTAANLENLLIGGN